MFMPFKIILEMLKNSVTAGTSSVSISENTSKSQSAGSGSKDH
jgi:hypothetical protein